MPQQDHLTKISFYIVAHADDWQLFMCPNVYKDIVASHTKTIFIITTAGDAGIEENFWRAREEGARSSLRFCVAPLQNIVESDGWKEFNYHSIYYWSACNATFYFLRLPDGNIDGKGFSTRHFQSLSKLKTGEINSITAVDDSSTYNSWKDLCSTVEEIIVHSNNGTAESCIHYINPDTTINANDHADHIATGEAIQCMNSIDKSFQNLYTGYSTSNTKNPINNTNLFWKTGMFAAYEKAVFDNSNYSTLAENANTYINWCLSSAQYVIIKPGNNA
jgi:hypothetical protein